MTLRGGGPRRGTALSKLGIIEDGAVLLRDGLIIAADTRARIESRKDARQAEKIDVGGRVILPGFVDSHTHLVHATSRAAEYELKIQGVSYEEIARKGGGILNSVKQLRAATSDALKRRALGALQEFASFGTTTVEAKSGYGLDVASELKILQLHRKLNQAQPLEIVSTFMGASIANPQRRPWWCGFRAAPFFVNPAPAEHDRLRRTAVKCMPKPRRRKRPVKSALCQGVGRRVRWQLHTRAPQG